MSELLVLPLRVQNGRGMDTIQGRYACLLMVQEPGGAEGPQNWDVSLKVEKRDRDMQ